MWSPGSAAPLRLEPRSSPRLAMLLLVSHGGAVIVAGFLAWPWWACCAGALAVLASLAVNWRRHVLRRGARAVTAAVWQGDGRWRLETGDGVLDDAKLAACHVHPGLVVLCFRGPGRGYRLLLFADAVPAELHRRLRTRLRCR